MKTILTGILSLFIFFGTVPTLSAMDSSNGMEEIKKLEKDGQISEDDQHRYADDIQKLTDDHVKKIDDNLAKKEEDIMAV